MQIILNYPLFMVPGQTRHDLIKQLLPLTFIRSVGQSCVKPDGIFNILEYHRVEFMLRKIAGKEYFRCSEGPINKYLTTRIAAPPVDFCPSRMEIEFYEDSVPAELTHTYNPPAWNDSKNLGTGDCADGWYIKGE